MHSDKVTPTCAKTQSSARNVLSPRANLAQTCVDRAVFTNVQGKSLCCGVLTVKLTAYNYIHTIVRTRIPIVPVPDQNYIPNMTGF